MTTIDIRYIITYFLNIILMLSAETETKLSKLLLLLADAESTCDLTRRTLSNHFRFDAYALFKLLDVENKGFIDHVNISDFLRKHNIYASSFEAQQIIFHFDSDSNNSLNYSEFLPLIISDRYLLHKHSSSYQSFESVPYDVEYSLVRLLEKELNFVKANYDIIRDLNLRYDFSISDAFRALDVLGLGNVNSESIRKFLIRNYITPTEEDLRNIVKRLDINNDYRIDFYEFKKLITSYNSGYMTTSIYSSSPLRKQYYSPIRTTLYCSPKRCYSPLRSYYSPVRTRTYVSPFKSFQPEKLYSPKRVESPERNKLNSTQGSSGLSYQPKETKSYLPLSYEEEVFLNYLKELLLTENKLESNKNEVSLKSDFNMEDVFSIFEKYNKGFISEFDFKDGLNSYFGLFPLPDEVAVLFKRYDNERNLSLSYGDFFNMLAPVNSEFRRLVEDRIYRNSSLVGNPLSSLTRLAVKSLLDNILNLEQGLEVHRKKMKNLLSFNSRRIFESIAGYGSNYFSEKDMMFYLDKQGISYLPKDIDLLFIRLSRNKKGLISFDQFLEEINPRY